MLSKVGYVGHGQNTLAYNGKVKIRHRKKLKFLRAGWRQRIPGNGHSDVEYELSAASDLVTKLFKKYFFLHQIPSGQKSWCICPCEPFQLSSLVSLFDGEKRKRLKHLQFMIK
jgi:hypothetical protein